MKISKITIFIIIAIFLALLIIVGRTAYNLGQHNATLIVKETTPLQIAEAMEKDNFYGEYIRTMLLVKGTVKTVIKQNSDTIVQFVVTASPTVLGKVTCDLGNNQMQIKSGDVIRVLTVAYDAKRENGLDVYMPNCYLLK